MAKILIGVSVSKLDPATENFIGLSPRHLTAKRKQNELPQSASLRLEFPKISSIQRRFYSSSEFPASQALASTEQAQYRSYSASTGSNGSSVR